jgi:hypothetical protein
MMVQLRDRNEAHARAVEFTVVRVPQVRHAGETAVISKGPAVIGADETRRIAVVGPAQTVAAMAADIEECAYGSGGVAHHQNRVLAHPGGQEIAGLRNLAVVTKEQPAASEDLPQLGLIDFRLNEDPPADDSGFGIDERAHAGCHSRVLFSAGANVHEDVSHSECSASAFGGFPIARPACSLTT